MTPPPFDGMRLPAIAAPMFINSSRDLVVSCVNAGIAAAFPSLNPREAPVLADWIDEIGERTNGIGRHGVNLIVHRTNAMLDSHLEVVCRKKVPFVVTSLGAAGDVVSEIHAYGGKVLHDVISRRHAEKAIEAGVDGLILVSAGAGGHGGTLNPLAFVSEIREIYDGLIILAGGISTGRGIAAARAAGADMAYLGTRFIATHEAEVDDAYVDMITRARAADVTYTNRVSGVHGNFLHESIVENGIDLEAPAKAYEPGALRKDDKKKGAWKRIWSGGHGVGTIHEKVGVATLIDQLESEYEDAVRDLAGGLRKAAE